MGNCLPKAPYFSIRISCSVWCVDQMEWVKAHDLPTISVWCVWVWVGVHFFSLHFLHNLPGPLGGSSQHLFSQKVWLHATPLIRTVKGPAASFAQPAKLGSWQPYFYWLWLKHIVQTHMFILQWITWTQWMSLLPELTVLTLCVNPSVCSPPVCLPSHVSCHSYAHFSARELATVMSCCKMQHSAPNRTQSRKVVSFSLTKCRFVMQ